MPVAPYMLKSTPYNQRTGRRLGSHRSPVRDGTHVGSLTRKSEDDWILQYPPAYPLYRALEASSAQRGTRLSGVSAFVVDVCAEGLIEWAMEPLDDGDASRLDAFLGRCADWC